MHGYIIKAMEVNEFMFMFFLSLFILSFAILSLYLEEAVTARKLAKIKSFENELSKFLE